MTKLNTHTHSTISQYKVWLMELHMSDTWSSPASLFNYSDSKLDKSLLANGITYVLI